MAEGFFPLFKDYCSLDAVLKVDLTSHRESPPIHIWTKINQEFENRNAKILYGGYLERRNFYAESPIFNDGRANRDIHLGVDYWVEAGTSIYTPTESKILSLRNNIGYLNYGPTVIVQIFHPIFQDIHLLFGHLTLESLSIHRVGDILPRGHIIGYVGDFSINGNWPPHLHLQLIKNIGNFDGDYPGLCDSKDIDFFTENCPEPTFPIVSA